MWRSGHRKQSADLNAMFASYLVTKWTHFSDPRLSQHQNMKYRPDLHHVRVSVAGSLPRLLLVAISNGVERVYPTKSSSGWNRRWSLGV